MLDRRAFFIDGSWVAPIDGQDFEVVNPATEEAVAVISLGGAEDVDYAARAARDAFEMWSESSVSERAGLLRRAREIYLRRRDEFAEAMTKEMGVELLVSATLLESAGVDTGPLDLHRLDLRGVRHPLDALAVPKAAELDARIAPSGVVA